MIIFSYLYLLCLESWVLTMSLLPGSWLRLTAILAAMLILFTTLILKLNTCDRSVSHYLMEDLNLILFCIAILGVRLRSSKTVCSALEENRLGGRTRWGRRRSACTSTISLSPLKRLWGGGCLLHLRVQPHTLI